jgi:hypothetical protein
MIVGMLDGDFAAAARVAAERADSYVLWQHVVPVVQCFRGSGDTFIADSLGESGVGLYLSAAKLFAMAAAYMAFPRRGFVGVVHQLEAAFRRATLDLRASPCKQVKYQCHTLSVIRKVWFSLRFGAGRAGTCPAHRAVQAAA